MTSPVDDLLEEIKDLKSTVEGLETQLHDTEGAAIQLSDDLDRARQVVNEQDQEIAQHRARYSKAIEMIQHKQSALQNQRSAYRSLAEVYSNMANKLVDLNRLIRDLHDVPVDQIDASIDVVADELGKIILS